MAVYQIVEIGDEVLRQQAKKIKEITPQIEKLLDNLKDTLAATEIGVGLAAPQIGVSKCAIVVDLDDELYELINPEIVEATGLATDSEGCLSVPGLIGDVERAERVLVRALNRRGKEMEILATGLLARVFQHEIDHLKGILFVDRTKNIQSVE
ncbi:MAG TPA: peptide deformylase [Clostridia bacterium]|jgi:peptide deformylase|nr:peptide deformylase [Clostridia bacterium]HHY05808.1 peptide deformylase [Clostridia bacterium]